VKHDPAEQSRRATAPGRGRARAVDARAVHAPWPCRECRLSTPLRTPIRSGHVTSPRIPERERERRRRDPLNTPPGPGPSRPPASRPLGVVQTARPGPPPIPLHARVGESAQSACQSRLPVARTRSPLAVTPAPAWPATSGSAWALQSAHPRFFLSRTLHTPPAPPLRPRSVYVSASPRGTAYRSSAARRTPLTGLDTCSRL